MSIIPSGTLSGVLTIEAIRVLRIECGLPLKEAKRRVEAMVEAGRAELDLGGILNHLGDPAAVEMARQACDLLEATGVSLQVDGLPLRQLLDGTGPDPVAPDEAAPPGFTR